MKTLIVYFSAERGTTARAAREAAESLGATYTASPGSTLAQKLGKSGAVQTGQLGDYGCISFIVTKILTSKTDKTEPLLAA